MKLERLSPSQFNRWNWTAGSIHDVIEGACRYWNITRKESKQLLKKYAVGWCYGEQVLFKPKYGEIAIMCFKDGRKFWFHLRKPEFIKVFGNIV